MPTSDAAELALVDANVLVYAFYPEHEHHNPSRQLLDDAQNGKHTLAVVPQVLAEFYSVVTDARRVTQPRQPAEALDAIERILAMPGVTLLLAPADLVTRWVQLARQHQVTRGAIFDLQLAATMLGNGVTTIYTFDAADFQKFSELTVHVPEAA